MYQGRNMITHNSGHARALFLSALTATNSLDDAGPMSCSVFDIQSSHTAPAVIKHLWVEQESSWPRWALALGSWAGNLTSEVLAFDEGGPPVGQHKICPPWPEQHTTSARSGRTTEPVAFAGTIAVLWNCVWAIAGPHQKKRRPRHPHRQL